MDSLRPPTPQPKSLSMTKFVDARLWPISSVIYFLYISCIAASSSNFVRFNCTQSYFIWKQALFDTNITHKKSIYNSNRSNLPVKAKHFDKIKNVWNIIWSVLFLTSAKRNCFSFCWMLAHHGITRWHNISYGLFQKKSKQKRGGSGWFVTLPLEIPEKTKLHFKTHVEIPHYFLLITHFRNSTSFL